MRGLCPRGAGPSNKKARSYTNTGGPNPVRLSVAEKVNSRKPNTPENRLQSIGKLWSNPYPRIKSDPLSITCAKFRFVYHWVPPNKTADGDQVVVHGRIRSHRTAGSKLIFFDILHNGHKVQVLCNQRILNESGVTPAQFREFYHQLRRGDSFSVKGKPHRTGRGELSILATELPTLISPCLHDVPLPQKDQDTSPYDRHVELLSQPGAADLLRARARILLHIRNFFTDREFMEVNTPILASNSGGAVAQPFLTTAKEFPDRCLSLRIAPELWLKRLVVGGFDRVFEIGSSFRNEGIDKTHNPEFTTCEFYQTYVDLDALMRTTESLMSSLSHDIKQLNEKLGGSLNPISVNLDGPYPKLDFIPDLEKAMGKTLPDLRANDAMAQVQQLFHDLDLPIPTHITLPRLLDKLSSIYLEPLCKQPTFIINHPECMSPLSKSFLHPSNGQVVSARAELFIDSKEIVNMYEEENSPFAQRQKFENQLVLRDPEDPGELDEGYIKTLEWGLPPTGGWGCGIDRLCMLFTGAPRIGDVLSFGNLRRVTVSSKAVEASA
ncbi:hypothetical protein FQN57_005373 [Myotisia sp. PD_48]|nr:hypothetical protein FQN57_005373 [Myotisia sp. PD_48]